MRTILLVEDNEDDVFFMRRALTRANLQFNLAVASDGQQALDYLAGNGRYSDRTRHPLPALVFLDLKLPYVHGFDVLEWTRRHPSLKDLPVIVLTSSPEERDRQRARELGAQAYVVKPPTPQSVLDAVRLLDMPALHVPAPPALS